MTRQSLREYQNAVLARMESARGESPGSRTQLFGFVLGRRRILVAGEHLAEVASVSALEPVPLARPWVCGAANIKGQVHVVVDLAVMLGEPPVKRGKYLALDASAARACALVVESLAGLFDASALGVVAPRPPNCPEPAWLAGTLAIDGHTYHLLDVPELIRDIRFARLQSGETR